MSHQGLITALAVCATILVLVSSKSCKLETDCVGPSGQCTTVGNSYPTCVNGSCVCVGTDCVLNCTRFCYAACKTFDSCRLACMPKGTTVTTIACKPFPAPLNVTQCDAAKCADPKTPLGNTDGCIAGKCACFGIECGGACSQTCKCEVACAPKCVVKTL